MKYSVLTINWGSEFFSEHVNILFRAAKDMSSLDFPVYLYDRWSQGFGLEYHQLADSN